MIVKITALETLDVPDYPPTRFVAASARQFAAPVRVGAEPG